MSDLTVRNCRLNFHFHFPQARARRSPDQPQTSTCILPYDNHSEATYYTVKVKEFFKGPSLPRCCPLTYPAHLSTIQPQTSITAYSHFTATGMTLLSLKEDRPTPSAVYNWRVYVCAGIASLASCMIGYDSAFIGTTLALPSFVKEFFQNESKQSIALLKQNIVSVYQAGAFFGSLAAYATSYFLGRRMSLLLFTLVFILGAGMMLGANGDRGTGLIIGGRVLAGFGVGGCSNMTPIYISELSPPAVRGRLVGIYELGWQIGGLVGFWINYGVNTTLAPTQSQWLIPFAVQLIPAGMLLIGAFFIPESPRWLLSKGRRDQAMKNLCWIRQLDASDVYIVQEVSSIDAEMERFNHEVGAGFWKPFLSLKQRRIQWRFFLGAMLFVFQNGEFSRYPLHV